MKRLIMALLLIHFSLLIGFQYNLFNQEEPHIMAHYGKSQHPEELIIFDREKGTFITEKVYGGKALRFLYQNPLGKVVSYLLSFSWWSHLYGWYQNSALSRKNITPFIDRYKIPMEDYERGEGKKDDHYGFSSFNQFFIRQFRPGLRSFEEGASNQLPAFAEGRYLAFKKVTKELVVPIKGRYLMARALLGEGQWSATFEGGPLIIARLCPVDYHRFHFPDSGKVVAQYRIPGSYHSVNPWAITTRPDIFMTNERQVTILDTDHFGPLAYIEVGAMSVGKIVQTHKIDQPFTRGQQKGYFLFGGSTVILLGQRGKWTPDADILNHSEQGIETYIKLGSSIASGLSL